MHAASFRGQPLLLLGGLLGGWVVMRVIVWAPPFAELAPLPQSLASAVVAKLASTPPSSPAPAARAAPRRWPLVPALPGAGPLAPVPWRTDLAPAPFVPEPLPAGDHVPVRVAAGHNLLLMAGLAAMEIPAEVLAYVKPAMASGVPQGGSPGLATLAPSRVSSWSADGWLLLRDDRAGPLAPGQPSYGRSQAGAVVRYQLSDGGHRPQAYLRGSASLAGAREEEGAVGLSARPFGAVPVRVAGEARVTATGQGTEVRPAAYAVTELPPMRLPLATRGEAYVQAGWVGGHFATPFVDGQVRVDRPVARLGDAEVSAGAGAWGGAQKGAARLDVGPSARVSFHLGDGQGRVAADYRFRVAGNAQPASGPVLTLSAGF